ncbi:MAG: efflux RND transporter periplasmic adaptor subunit [Angelakisella sp.]
MYSMKKRAAAAVVSAAMLVAATGCGAAVPTAASVAGTPEGILLTAATPERGDLALSTAFVGSVQPDQLVSVMPKLMGTVKQVHVTVGQQVKKGDLLMTLDDADVLPSYNQALAGYNMAKAQTDQMTGSGYKSSLSNLDTAYDNAFDNYERAKEGVDYAESELKDAKQTLADLRASGTATPEELASATAAVKVAEAAYDKADSALDMSRKYYNNAKNSYNAMKTEGEVELQAIADATLKQAESGLNMAKQQLENTKLYAPIDGVVESVSVTEMNMVGNSAPAFVIANKSALVVSFSVSSAAVLSMEVGDTVRVEKGQNTYTATITEVGTIVNPQTGLFTVKAAIEGAGSDLLTGVSVKVSADTEKTDNAILVAQDSLYYDDGKPYVYLMVNGEGDTKVAKKTFVETGISTPEKIEIVSGISDDDLVITSWHPNLLDGAIVALATTEPAAETASTSAPQEG